MASPSSSPSSSNEKRDTRTLNVAKYTAISSLTSGLVTAAYQATLGRTRALREIENASSPSAGPSNVNANTTATPRTDIYPPSNQLSAAARYRHPVALLSASAAFNTGVVAFCFFNLREYVVSPALEVARSGQFGKDGGERQKPLSWTSMHTHNLFDSALTGAILGGAYRSFTNGLAKLPSGAFTASLACTALQVLVNELSVLRIHFVASSQRSTVESSKNQASSVSDSSPLINDSAESTSAMPQQVSQPSSGISNTRNPPGVEETPFVERALRFIGITKVADEEYIRRLKAKREIHLTRIRELEEQIRQESGTNDGENNHEDSDN